MDQGRAPRGSARCLPAGDAIALLVDNLTSCATISELDKEIERLRQFQAAGLTEIALRIYEKPADTIRLIGERVVPALR